MKCVCRTSHNRSLPGRVRDWHALQVRQAAIRKHLVISALLRISVLSLLSHVLPAPRLVFSHVLVFSLSLSLSGSVSPGLSMSSKVVSCAVKLWTL